ncbi:MAG: metal-dependent transcriptional regulator [Lentisphaerae bacterium]|nr:metal-dependent transcriptional regulator [Lentisphaerota bacterium]
MGTALKLSASLEDYLEAIYVVSEEKSAARATDVGEKLGVANSSVTNALQSLVKKKLVKHAPYDLITLTPKGKSVARRIVRRHRVLKDFFVNVLAVTEEVGEDCACKVEHVVPDEVLERFTEYIKFEASNHRGGTSWVEGTGFVCDDDVAVRKGKAPHD